MSSVLQEPDMSISLPVVEVTVQVAGPEHFQHAEAVCALIEEAAKARGTGIAKREPAYITRKMEEGKAVIALCGDELAGFCYIETWTHNRYVANSGLIVAPSYRRMGLAKRIKRAAFNLSRQKYPEALSRRQAAEGVSPQRARKNIGAG